MSKTVEGKIDAEQAKEIVNEELSKMEEKYYTKDDINTIINEALEKITIVHIDDDYKTESCTKMQKNKDPVLETPLDIEEPCDNANELFPTLFDDLSPIKQPLFNQPLQSTPIEKQNPIGPSAYVTPPPATPGKDSNDSFNSPDIPMKAKSTGGADVSRRLAMLSPKAKSEYNFDSDRSLEDADSVASSYYHSNPFDFQDDTTVNHFSALIFINDVILFPSTTFHIIPFTFLT